VRAETISLNATFNGLVFGNFNGVVYVGPTGRCPSGATCSFTYLPESASVNGAVTVVPEPSGFFSVSQSFAISGPFGSVNLSSQAQSALSAPCVQNLLFCLSVASIGTPGFAASDLLGNQISLQPNYSGSPLSATTLPIIYPFNFTQDTLQLTNGTGGGFRSGSQGNALPSTCAFIGGTFDSFGKCGIGSVSGIATSTISSPPTVQALLTMEQGSYLDSGAPPVNETINGTTTTYNPVSQVKGDTNFHATVYQTADGAQTVVVLRGGTLEDAYTNIEALATFTNTPGTIVTRQTTQLAALVANLASQNPTTQITLTSYSVGGLPTQIVGHAAGIQTVTFDSQGAANLLDAFPPSSLPNLSGILSPSSQIVNYRLFGDQVSQWSPQVGTSITVDNPNGNAIVLLTADDLLPFQQFMYGWHSRDDLATTLSMEPAEFPGTIGPLEVPGIAGPGSHLPLIEFGSIFIPQIPGGITNINYQNRVNAGIIAAKPYDPPPGLQYSLTETPGSPEFASIELPIFDDIAAWELTFFTDAGFSQTQISTTGEFDFGPGVDRLDFFALDDLNDPVPVPESFIFVLAFDTDGTFVGNLAVTSAVASVPEPSSLMLITLALGCLAFSSRKTLRTAVPRGFASLQAVVAE
jgi:hypothetical protein